MNPEAARLRHRWTSSMEALGGFGNLGSTASNAASGVAGGLFAGLQGAVRQLAYAARGQLGAHTAQINAIQRQEYLERIKDRQPAKASPAIKALEVGTQEAYRYLTREQTAANKLAKEAEKKRQADMEKGRQQAEQMITFLGQIADWAQDNGFQPIR